MLQAELVVDLDLAARDAGEEAIDL
jgi:hypothetical protein